MSVPGEQEADAKHSTAGYRLFARHFFGRKRLKRSESHRTLVAVAVLATLGLSET